MENTLQVKTKPDMYHTCIMCKKEVYTGMFDMKRWAYKKGKAFCCSYSCYIKANGLTRKFK